MKSADAVPSTMVPRVLLVDDHELVLDALQAFFSGEWNIVGRLHHLDTLLHTARLECPDVVVLDIGMGFGSSFDAARELKQQVPGVKIIFLTMHEDPDLVAEAFRSGASAYVLKRSVASELSTAVRAAMDGKQYVTPALLKVAVDSLSAPSTRVELSPRQQAVLRLLARGYAMKEIATALDISPRTVAFHKYRMMSELGITSSAELIQYAVRRHLI